MKELIIIQTFDKDGFLTGYEVKGEIVRCKDCCYWSGLPKEELALCSVYDNVYAITPRDGFCHKGRRSE